MAGEELLRAVPPLCLAEPSDSSPTIIYALRRLGSCFQVPSIQPGCGKPV